MNKPKLTYFDFDGGRGEVPRIAFTLGGVDFEDDRVPFLVWAERKPATPFAALPVLEIGGQTVAQSNTINRYVLTGLCPTDPWQAALCDEAMDAVEDIAVKIAPTFDMAAPEKRTAHAALAKGPIPFFLSGLAARLKANGGRFFADDRLTVADLKSSALGQASEVGRIGSRTVRSGRSRCASTRSALRARDPRTARARLLRRPHDRKLRESSDASFRSMSLRRGALPR